MLFGFAYWLTLDRGFQFSLRPHFEPPIVWPVTAIYLSALFISPYRRWPFVMLTAAVACILANFSMHSEFNTRWLGFWLTDTVTIGLSTYLLRRLRNHFGRNTTNEVIVYLVLGAFVQPASTAFLISWNAARLGLAPFTFEAWHFHFSAMTVSLLAIAPFLVTYGELFRARGVSETLRTFARDLRFRGTTLGLYLPVLGSTYLPSEWRLPIVLVPVMAWISFRGRVELTTFANFAVCFALINLTLLGRIHYFAVADTSLAVVVGLQLYISCNTVLQLLLTSAVNQRNCAERALRAANEAKSKFVAYLSHEIRAPLGAVVGYVDLAQDAGGERLQEYLKNARRNAEHLEHLVNNVLDLSKLEAKKLTAEKSVCDIPEILETCRSMLRATAARRALTFRSPPTKFRVLLKPTP